jgi:SM-20-related protein
VSNSFDELIDSYITNHIGISNNFLGKALALCLSINLGLLLEHQMLNPARTGNDTLPVLNNLVRGDKIYWLDRSHNNAAENVFFDLMDGFVKHLNSTCFTGITGYEFHYTLYEPGSFYKKHIDQFKTDGSRQYSMVMYLNEVWVAPDGGQL